MASTRSTRKSPSAASAAVSSSDAVIAIVRESVRLELATVSALGNAFVAWARSADRLLHAVGSDAIVGITAATAAHLNDLAALPGAAANHFEARLARASNNA